MMMIFYSVFSPLLILRRIDSVRKFVSGSRENKNPRVSLIGRNNRSPLLWIVRTYVVEVSETIGDSNCTFFNNIFFMLGNCPRIVYYSYAGKTLVTDVVFGEAFCNSD
jgi:hypothetical protein